MDDQATLRRVMASRRPSRSPSSLAWLCSSRAHAPIQVLHVLAQPRLSPVHSGVESRFEARFHLLHVLARDGVQVGSKLRDSFSWPGWDRTCHRSGDRGSGGLDSHTVRAVGSPTPKHLDRLMEGPFKVAVRGNHQALFCDARGVISGLPGREIA